MNEQDLPELEELADEAPAPAPEPVPEQPAAAIHYAQPTYAPQPAHKQLYQFLWGGIAVLFGCLLPMVDGVEGWAADQFQPTLEGPIGLMTVGGAIAGFFAILVIGAQIYCMKFRKLLLTPIVIMAGIAAWGWVHLVPAFDAVPLFSPEDAAEPYKVHHVFWKADAFVDLWRHIGVGYLFVTAGSTYVVLVFLKELLGLGGKKKPAAGEAAPAARGRGRRR